MKVLVIDDTKVHLTAALQTLAGHDVIVCSTHNDAAQLVRPQYDEAKKKALIEKYRAEGMDGNEVYDRAYKESRLPYWDAVLCDLLMPAGSMAQGGEGLRHVGEEMPVGWSLALQAAKNGAKFVAVVTDTNHHHHPASAMLDGLNGHLFSIDGAKMLLTNYVSFVGITGTECACEECGGSGKKSRNDGSQYECVYCKGSGQGFSQKGKDWGKILSQVLGIKEEED